MGAWEGVLPPSHLLMSNPAHPQRWSPLPVGSFHFWPESTNLSHWNTPSKFYLGRCYSACIVSHPQEVPQTPFLVFCFPCGFQKAHFSLKFSTSSHTVQF